MKKLNLNKDSILAILVFSLAFALLSFAGPTPAFAATAPDLGAAEDYSVFGKAGVTNTGAGTHAWGDVGADATNVTGLIASQVDGTIDAGTGVEAAILSAYADLDGEGATGALNLAGTNTVTPGVYTVGATTLNGTLTLNGAGVYIFRSSSSISTSGAAIVSLTNGAAACNVFWQIPAAMTIGAGTQMVGTIIADTELISLAAGASLEGRALSRIAQVTLDDNQITEPGCAAAPATINVVKTVVNDNGRSLTVADFPLFVGATPVTSGDTNVFAPATYTVSETTNANYTQTFSGDCDVNGSVTIVPGDAKFCIITNNDIAASGGGGGSSNRSVIPPLIDVVKVPNPLALPAGPGQVEYTYTLSNTGTVPVTDITMVGDTCSPIILVSGDTDGDNRLDVNETWIHTCTTTLSVTHTNTVVATGWANGISAVDIASATVVVGFPVMPPLIHVTKVPSPLALPAGGGLVNYTKRLTNPGTVALSNIRLTDDKCSPLNYISGDMDGDSELDTTEVWVYTCLTNLFATTTNTAIATGEANGLTATDFAIATVIVAPGVPTGAVILPPALPRTGFGLPLSILSWSIVAAGFLAFTLLFSVFWKKQTE